MERKALKLNGIIWLVILAGSVTFLAWCGYQFLKGGSGMGFLNENSANYVVRKEETFTENLDAVSLGWVSGSVQVLKSEGNEIRVVQKAAADFPEEDLFRSKMTGAELEIKDGRQGFNLFSFGINRRLGTEIELYLPEKEFDKLNISSVSGRITTIPLEAKTLKMSSTSGSIQTSGAFGGAEISSISGGIDLSDCVVRGKLGISNTSGGINGNAVEAGEVRATTVSGSIRLDGAYSSAELSTTSGGVRFSSTRVLDGGSFHSVSGGLRVALPENKGFTANVSKVSGSFHSDFPVSDGSQKNVYIFGDGAAAYNFSTVSGSIQLSKV